MWPREHSCEDLGVRSRGPASHLGPPYLGLLEKFGPATDAGATNFVRSTQAHSGLQCPELAQLRLQIVPRSTLCRADWVRNDPVLTTRGWLLRHYDPVSPGAARGHAASEHQRGIIDGPGQAGAIAGAILTWRNSHGRSWQSPPRILSSCRGALFKVEGGGPRAASIGALAAIHGVVRWRACDLIMRLHEEFGFGRYDLSRTQELRLLACERPAQGLQAECRGVPGRTPVLGKAPALEPFGRSSVCSSPCLRSTPLRSSISCANSGSASPCAAAIPIALRLMPAPPTASVP
jgi:hypothetical protein